MTPTPDLLKRIQKHLQTLDPGNQAVAYTARQWEQYVPNDEDLAAIVATYPQQISWANLATLATEIRGNEDRQALRRLFLATMIWGYGKVGYGPSRTVEMLRDERVQEVLPQTFGLLQAGKLVEAYQGFHLQACHPACFTKFFSVLGVGTQLQPCPLLLDARVADSLEQLLAIDIAPLAKVTRDGYGRISSVERYAEGYQRYVEMIHEWAEDLQCRAETLAYYLSSSNAQLTIGAQIGNMEGDYTNDHQEDEQLAMISSNGEDRCVQR